jgi:hypothetical protein
VPVSDAEHTVRTQIWPGVRRCYQLALRADPTEHGRIVILIRVEPSGAVGDASIASNAGLSERLATCAAAVAREARFPPPGPGGAKIALPFNLVLHGQGPAAAPSASPSPDTATAQTTQGDAIIQRIQATRDSVAAKYDAAGSSNACIRKHLGELDELLESAQNMRRDAQPDMATATSALIEHYESMLRGIESLAKSRATEADRCP